MQSLPILLAIILCNLIGCRKTENGPVYTGRLEIDGICGNYTLTVLNGGLDTSQVQHSWTDPTTNITYSNAFGLTNPCAFPDSINAGDTFEFQLVTDNRTCIQCLAFYPTPAKSLSIRVVTR
ncbi:MAG: hypothetical protein ACKO6Q_05775 [Bacteroidota bacterium]